MSSLPSIGASISSFWMNIQPFVVGMQVMGPDALNGVTTLVEMLTMITGANLLEGLGQFFGAGNSMDKFADNIVKFGVAISEFSAVLSAGNFNGETVTAAANAGKALAEMQSMMQGEGGIFTMFEGVKDMGAFGEQIKAFGEAMVEFSEVVDGNISESAVTAAANAGKTFAELQKAIGPTGGNSVLEFFSGTKDLGDFGAQIKAFGEAMVDFSNTVDEGAINEEAVTQAKNAGEIMAALEDSIDTTSGGVVGFFAGETNLESFGAQIKAFGEAMVEFSNALTDNGGVDTEAITKAKEAGAAMSDLANSLPTYAFGSGKLDLTGFGNDLTDYAGSLSRMASTLESVDLSKISQASGIASKVSDILVSLQGVDESVINKFWVLDTLATSLSNFSNNIGEINTEKISLAIGAAQRVAQLIQSLSGITGESVSGFANAVSQLGSVTYDQIYASFSSVDFSLIGVNVMTGLAQGIQVGAQNVQAQLNIVLSSLGNYTTQESETFYMGGLRLATELATGIQNGASGVSSAVTSVMSSAVSALSGYESQFYSAGSNLALGFANGISSSAFAASTAAAAMASAAASAARNALDIHSPSRVMEEIGEYSGEGLVVGLDNSTAAVEQASEDLAKTVSDTVEEEVKKNGFEGLVAALGNIDPNDIFGKTFESIKSLSKSLPKKLGEVFKGMSESMEKLVNRRNQLNSVATILGKTGVTFSEGFVQEILSSESEFAEALGEMTKLSEENVQKIVDAFDQSQIAEIINEVTEAFISDKGLMKAFASTGQSVEVFARRIKDLGLTAEDVTNAISSLTSMTQDAFSAMSVNSDNNLAAFKQNLQGNIRLTRGFAKNVEQVFSKISDYAPADAFRKEVLEGGFSEYGRLMMDLVALSREELIEVIDLWNEAGQVGLDSGMSIVNNLIPDRVSLQMTGEDIAEGIAEGITDGSSSVNNAAELMCVGVDNTIRSYFGIASPSKLMAKIGGYLVSGLTGGFKNKFSDVKNTIELLGSTIENSVRSLSDSDLEIHPRIVPVVDSTEALNKLALLNSDYAARPSASVLSRVEMVSSKFGQNGIDSSQYALKNSIDALSNTIDNLGPDAFGYHFNQYNSSPKALNNSEIYRRTRNQLSLAKKSRGR